ncbi:unnamed protein product [Nezara viridula]|uniref:Uncharacterized protein n=1 Tax=Nezara viridula TaxID=85310 RepID=A0A9P0HQ87_NEZVI|nr:unnamed protein product [Nezara viridula]
MLTFVYHFRKHSAYPQSMFYIDLLSKAVRDGNDDCRYHLPGRYLNEAPANRVRVRKEIIIGCWGNYPQLHLTFL